MIPRKETQVEQRFTHPALFGIVELPFSAAVGYLQIAIPYFFAKQGVPLAQIAALSAIAFLPHAWKFTWVPILDLGLGRRTWYLLATGVTALLLGIVVFFPDPTQHLGAFTALVTAAQVGAATSSASVDALMALTTRPSDKGRAGGFKMAGNVGGIGVLGTLPIWLSSHASQATSGAVVAGLVVVSGAAGFLIAPEARGPDAARAAGTSIVAAAVRRIAGMWRDIFATMKSREGWTGLVLCAAPVGCGALVNLSSALSDAYGAPEATVEMVNGLGGGLVGAMGAVLGGFLADRMNRRLAYCASAGLTAAVCFAMAAAPMTSSTYAAGVLAYRFANGITMASFAGMVLELVSRGPAVATKYTMFVAVSNQAIAYVTYLDGQASRVKNLGAVGAVLFDGLFTVLGIAIVGTMTWILRRRAQPKTGSGAPPLRADL